MSDLPDDLNLAELEWMYLMPKLVTELPSTIAIQLFTFGFNARTVVYAETRGFFNVWKYTYEDEDGDGYEFGPTSSPLGAYPKDLRPMLLKYDLLGYHLPTVREVFK